LGRRNNNSTFVFKEPVIKTKSSWYKARGNFSLPLREKMNGNVNLAKSFRKVWEYFKNDGQEIACSGILGILGFGNWSR
jgi:hypothetical protein